MFEPIDHVMVISAMSRLARHRGWARILEGKPIEDEIVLIDAALLVEAGALQRNPHDSLELAQAHSWHYDPEALAAGLHPAVAPSGSDCFRRAVQDDGAQLAGEGAVVPGQVDVSRPPHPSAPAVRASARLWKMNWMRRLDACS